MFKKSLMMLSALFYIMLSHQPSNAADAAPSMSAKADSSYGHASNSPTDAVFLIMPGKARDLNVKRFETVRITDGVKTVTWTFDTKGTPAIPLSAIFPGASGTIYVDESPLYAF